MCKELNELYDSLSADHKNDLLVIAKSMKDIENVNKAFDNVLAISKARLGNP